MSGHDLSRLAPADLATTLRSFDRRFRRAVRPVDDPAVELWVEVPGPDGHSARDHVAAAGRSLTVLHDALRRVLTHDTPYLDEAVVRARDRTWQLTPSAVEVELDVLGDTAGRFADRIDVTHGESWSRTGRTPGPGSVDAMEIAREAVRCGLAHLEGAQQAMDAARRD